MAQLDPSLADETPTGIVADRADIYRVAVRLVRDADLITDASPDDVLNVARFLEYGADFA
ncbi:hypothetical protein [Streptomyces sioyaensis]|uniref:hypothetical protein n=1 Tax=Streptomyces sioyaensis TaxID=67364 RepID=UPI0037B2F4CD